MLAPVRNAPHAGAMPCARVEHARWPPDTGDGSSTRDGGPAAPRQGRSTSDSEQGLEEGSRHALRTNPRHGRSCAWRRCRRLLTPARVELSFFRKKGKTRWRWESNPERERRDEVARMVRCAREDEEVDTLNLDRWMWASKEREKIRSNLDSLF